MTAPLDDEAAPSSSREPTDHAVIQGLLQRDAWAAAALYDRVYPSVDRALRRVLQERSADFDDLVQTTFERLVRTILAGQFRYGCSLRTWAASIAVHAGIDVLRTRTRERRVFSMDRDSSSSFPLDALEPFLLERRLEARSEIEHLQRTLAKMKPQYSTAVVLHDVLGHDLAEVAALTGITAAAAQSRLVRGRKDLLRRLTKAHRFEQGRRR